jgi:VWFA-related protein
MTSGCARGSVIAALLCFAGSALRAQPSPVIRTETREVLVDAIVTNKKGEYVRDLTAKDFRLWEDNKEQAIQSASLERGPVTSQPHYLVLFFAGMESAHEVAAREAILRFIDANAEPDRRMAVVYYNGALRIAQNFTDDAARLKEAVRGMPASSLAPSATDGGPTESTFERMSGRAANRHVVTAAMEATTRDTVRSLAALAANLGILPSRKMIVLLNGGLPSSSVQKGELTAAIDACNKSDVAVYPVDVRPLSPQAGTATDIRSASEGVAEVPGIKVRGLEGPQGQGDDSSASAPDAGANGQQILFSLAAGTGGSVVPNASQLQKGLQKIGEEQDAYYTLSYSPSDSKEGSCHALRVKVYRGGTTVRARSNYCASKPQDLLAGTSTAEDLERRAAGLQAGSTAASMQLSYFYLSSPSTNSPGVARVNLAMEIPADGLKFENHKGKLHAEIDLLGVASTADGGVGARFSDALKLDFDNQAEFESAKGKALHYEKEFKIVPGRYSFTLAFGSGGESFGKLEAPLDVEPRMPGELAMSSLALSKETHPAAELGLGGATSLTEDRTPLIAGDVQVVPSGSNQFVKSEPGYFYLELYTPDPAAVRLRVRVLDRKTGEAKSDSGPMKIEIPKQSHGDAIQAGSRLPIDKLAAGSYELEVTATDGPGKTLQRTAGFEVR